MGFVFGTISVLFWPFPYSSQVFCLYAPNKSHPKLPFPFPALSILPLSELILARVSKTHKEVDESIKQQSSQQIKLMQSQEQVVLLYIWTDTIHTKLPITNISFIDKICICKKDVFIIYVTCWLWNTGGMTKPR